MLIAFIYLPHGRKWQRAKVHPIQVQRPMGMKQRIFLPKIRYVSNYKYYVVNNDNLAWNFRESHTANRIVNSL
jgi:hypothetical protein